MNENQAVENKKYCAVLATGIGLIAVALSITGFGIAQREFQMIRIYLCTAFGLLLAYLCYALLAKLTASKPLFGPDSSIDGQERSGSIYSLVTILCCAITFALSFDFISLLNSDSSTGGYLAAYFASSIIACVIFSAARDGKATAAGKLTVAVSILFTLLMAFFYSFIPNLYDQPIWEIHHYNALVQQIYNVAFNEPYTFESSGIYGHYAIFLWPFLKLFGHGPVTINLMVVAGLLISEAVFIAVVFKVTKNNILRAAAILSGSFMFVNLFYGAVYPTRVLWPMIILAYTLYGDGSAAERKRPGLFWGLGYVLCGLAITWNTDSGIVATAAYSIAIWLRVWRDELPFSRKALKTYGLTLIGCAVALLVMIVIVNIYNLLCGGPLVFAECFFPMLGGEGYVDYLQDQPNEYNSGFFAMPTVIFVMSVITGMLSLRFIRACKTDRLDLAVCGLMGLAQSYYYFHRASAEYGCVKFYLILCLVIIAGFAFDGGRGANNLYTSAKKASGISGIIFLSAMVYSILYFSPFFLTEKFELSGVMDSFNELCEAVEREVPRDTYAFGYLTQDVYASLGWDPGYHYRDSSDMFGYGIENVYAEMAAQDRLLVSRSNYGDVIQELPGFTVVKEIDIAPEPKEGEMRKASFLLLEKTGT